MRLPLECDGKIHAAFSRLPTSGILCVASPGKTGPRVPTRDRRFAGAARHGRNGCRMRALTSFQESRKGRQNLQFYLIRPEYRAVV
ncbi:hypothetical protein L0N00_15630, partial [Eggerthella lenta]|nr:hypothetical protein [Eggerthella lenta]